MDSKSYCSLGLSPKFEGVCVPDSYKPGPHSVSMAAGLSYNQHIDARSIAQIEADAERLGLIAGSVTGMAGLARGLGKHIINNINKSARLKINSTAAVNSAKQGDTGKTGAKNLSLITSDSVNEKLQKYLLNPNHPVGASKAKWFRQALGFTPENLNSLAKQIRFDSSKAVQTSVTEYGIKFNQVIKITGENGNKIDVTFAWIQNNDGVVRLVTGIPTPK